MPEVLAGDGEGLTVTDIVRQMGDDLGYQVSNTRFVNAVLDRIQDTLLEIQIHEGSIGRTRVNNAAFTLPAASQEIDVRLPVDDGGFGWTNCHKVDRITLGSQPNLELARLDMNMARDLNLDLTETGPPTTIIYVDQYRIRFFPIPDTADSGYGDFFQSIPKLANDADSRVDWPKVWDLVLLEGVKWRMYQWDNPSEIVRWQAARNVFQELKSALRSNERNRPVRPNRVVFTRNLKRNLQIPRHNDTDVR